VLAVDVELLEGDAAGIQLVGVQEVLEPLPHLVFGPVLRVDLMPLTSKKPAGNCKTEGGPMSCPVLPRHSLRNGKALLAIRCHGEHNHGLYVAPWVLKHEVGTGEEADNVVLYPAVARPLSSPSMQ
jgi:hypothetical protein